ncbi:MAG: cation:proton antiporter [Phycisphaerales bacterium]|nr:cation:proton antiporter [Phycisphaerales bacterium]
MNIYTVLTIVLSITALAGWANERFLRLPSAIGVMLAGLVVAGSLLLCDMMNWIDDTRAIEVVKSLHFDRLLIGGHGANSAGQGVLLGMLLFASALQTKPQSMRKQVGLITWLATVGVIVTALMTAVGLMTMMSITGRPFIFLHLLLLGAILAPTDAVAAISLLRRTSAPARVRDVIAGESLFNDGISLVLVLFLLAMITGETESPFGSNWLLVFTVEAAGAVALGIVMGLLGVFFIRSLTRGSIILLTTIAIVMVTGALAPMLYVSCPVACVVAGLTMGRSRTLQNAEGDGQVVMGFWNLVEHAMTAILFLLIGLELLAVELSWPTVIWGFITLPLLIVARFVALVLPWAVARAVGRTKMNIWEVGLMTWCGLRGGVSIAMAIAIPLTIKTKEQHLTVQSQAMVVTLIVVVLSILIQGMTVERVAKLLERGKRKAADRAAAK